MSKFKIPLYATKVALPSGVKQADSQGFVDVDLKVDMDALKAMGAVEDSTSDGVVNVPAVYATMPNGEAKGFIDTNGNQIPFSLFADIATTVQKKTAAGIGQLVLNAQPSITETVPTQSGNRYYIDFINGSDSNNGTSPATPWKNITKLVGLNCGNGAIIFIAGAKEDGTPIEYVYEDTWANYKSAPSFPYNGADNLASSNASAPVIVRPYWPRGNAGVKPIIRHYASIAASDWTQETGLGSNVWSIPWVSGDSGIDFSVAYGADNKLGILATQQVAGQGYGNNGNNPLQMKNVGDYTKDANKLYFYSVGNPTSTHGSVKVFGRQSVFASSWQGGRNLKVMGLQFELCSAFTFENQSTVAVTGLEVARCTFKKARAVYFNNKNSNASPQECSLTIRDNVFEDIPHSAIRISSFGGTAGNTVSYEIYRNQINGGNLSASYGGALAYLTAKGGTKHHAWGNYGYDCRNGAGGNNIDGSFIYCDVGTDAALVFGNVAERCGVAFQQNNAKNCLVVSNLAIDCPVFVMTTGAQDAPTANISCIVAQNTWLWTGRVNPADIQLGPGISVNLPVFAEWNDGLGTYPFASYTSVNNLAIMVDSSGFSGKKVADYDSRYTGTTLVAGLAAFGFGGAPLVTNNGAAVPAAITVESGFSEDIFPDAAVGSARPALDSAIAGAGIPLSITYKDICGNSFTTPPAVGCYEPMA